MDTGSKSALKSEEPGIVLEDFLPYRLSVLSNTISNAIAGLYGDRFGLGIPDWRVMAVLARFPGSSAQQLVERTRMDKVAVSRAVNRLADRDLLQRDVADDDRRRSELSLSEDGWEIYGQIVPLAQDYEAQLMARIDAGHRGLLGEMLAELQQAAESLQPNV